MRRTERRHDRRILGALARGVAALWLCALTGCVQLAEREYYEGPRVKPCEKLVILHPEETVVCMTREEFARYLKKILPPSQ